MTTETILTSFFILAFGMLLVVGFMFEEKVIAFEEKLARIIAAIIICLRDPDAAERASKNAKKQTLRPHQKSVQNCRSDFSVQSNNRAA